MLKQIGQAASSVPRGISKAYHKIDDAYFDAHLMIYRGLGALAAGATSFFANRAWDQSNEQIRQVPQQFQEQINEIGDLARAYTGGAGNFRSVAEWSKNSVHWAMRGSDYEALTALRQMDGAEAVNNQVMQALQNPNPDYPYQDALRGLGKFAKGFESLTQEEFTKLIESMTDFMHGGIKVHDSTVPIDILEKVVQNSGFTSTDPTTYYEEFRHWTSPDGISSQLVDLEETIRRGIYQAAEQVTSNNQPRINEVLQPVSDLLQQISDTYSQYAGKKGVAIAVTTVAALVALRLLYSTGKQLILDRKPRLQE